MIETNIQNYFRKRLKPYLLIATVLFVALFISGFSSDLESASAALEDLEQLFEPLGNLGPFVLFLIILLNNTIKALGAIVMGIALGIPPFVFIVFNGFIIGAIVSVLGSAVGYGVIAASLVPHGIIEIPVLLLSTALGLSVGLESIKFLIGRKSLVRAQLRYGLKIYLKWILASLLIAAIIEVFVTPYFIVLAGGETILIQ